MTYTVVWLESAERELAKLYLDAFGSPSKRLRIAAAADYIDQFLKVDPDRISSGGTSSELIFFRPPLGISYRVIIPDRIVQIVAVAQIESF